MEARGKKEEQVPKHILHKRRRTAAGTVGGRKPRKKAPVSLCPCKPPDDSGSAVHKDTACTLTKKKPTRTQTNTLVSDEGPFCLPRPQRRAHAQHSSPNKHFVFFGGKAGGGGLLLRHDEQKDGVSLEDEEEKRSVVQRVRREEFMWTLEEIHQPTKSSPLPTVNPSFFFFLLQGGSGPPTRSAASSSHARERKGRREKMNLLRRVV